MSSRTTRSFAAGVALSISALGLSVFAPAQAASGNLLFDCTVVGQKHVFKTTADTDLPATLEEGQKATVNMTATVVAPDAVRQTAKNLKAATVFGTADIEGTINGKPVKVVATIPSTPVPDSGELTVQAAGAFEHLAEGTGAQTVKVDKYSATLEFRDAAGQPTAMVSKATIPCVPQVTTPAQDLTVDSFEVTAPPVQETESSVTAKYKKKTQKLVAKVAVLNADDSAAAGDVKLVLKKGKKKAGKATVTLNAKGKAKHSFTKITATGKYTLVAKYKGSEASKKSKETITVKVK